MKKIEYCQYLYIISPVMSPELLTIIILLFLSGFFSGSESALFSLRWWRLHFFTRSESRVDRMVAGLMERPRRLLVTILLGNTIVNVSSSSIAEHLLERAMPDQGLWVAIVVMTLALLIIGEITPKTIAISYPETIARVSVVPLRITGALLRPICYLLEKLTDYVTRKFDRRVSDHSGTSGRNLLHMVKESEHAGVFSEMERVIMEKILEMETMTLHRIMVPRTEMIALPENISLEKAVSTFMDHNLRRVPMYRESLDQITGILYAKDLLYESSRKTRIRTPREIMRSPIFAPGVISIKQLFDEMKRGSRHIAIVLDEYGGTAGLVTYDDILMSIFRQAPKNGMIEDIRIKEISSDIFRINPGISMHRLAEITGFHVPETPLHTLNGFVLDRLGAIPSEGDEFEWISPEDPVTGTSAVSWRIEITQVSDRRIEEIRLVKIPGRDA